MGRPDLEGVAMIDPVELPETDLILGSAFPVRDEDAYRREATSAVSAAEAATRGQMEMSVAAGYTDAEFLGLTGSALGGQFGARFDQFGQDHVRYSNVAAWLTWAAENIEVTKAAMNHTVSDYHASYDQAARTAVDESWPQVRLADAKDELVLSAQKRIADLAAGYHQRHEQAQQGIAAGSPAPAVPPMATAADE